MSLRVPGGQVTIRWPDLVGVARHRTRPVVTLIGADGFSFPVSAEWFRGGREAMELIEAHTTADISFLDSGDDEPPGRPR